MYFKYNFDYSNSNFKLEKIYEAILKNNLENSFNYHFKKNFQEIIGDKISIEYLIDYGFDFLFPEKIQEFINKELERKNNFKTENNKILVSKYLNNKCENNNQQIKINDVLMFKDLFNFKENGIKIDSNKVLTEILNKVYIKNFDEKTIDLFLNDNKNVISQELINFKNFKNDRNEIKNILTNSSLNYEQIKKIFINESDVNILGYIIDFFSKYGYEKLVLPTEIFNYENISRIHKQLASYAIKNFELNENIIQNIISSNNKTFIRLMYKNQYSNLDYKHTNEIETKNILSKEEIVKIKKLSIDEADDLINNVYNDITKEENIKNILSIIKNNQLSQLHIKQLLKIDNKYINATLLKTQQYIDEKTILENLEKFNINLILSTQHFSFEAIKILFRKKTISQKNFFYICNNHKYKNETKYFENFYDKKIKKENFSKNIFLNKYIKTSPPKKNDFDLLDYQFISTERLNYIVKNDDKKVLYKDIISKENATEEQIGYYLNDDNEKNSIYKIDLLLNNINFFVKNKNSIILETVTRKLIKFIKNNNDFFSYNDKDRLLKICLNLSVIQVMQKNDFEIIIDESITNHRENSYDCFYDLKKCKSIKPKVDLSKYLGLSI